MSLAVLAKKSRHYIDRVSGCGHNGFSVNGGYRNQGWVGQDMLGRTLIGTKFRGTEPLGHGGNNGTYTTTIINTCRPCTNDPSIIKRSNMNTAGYISSRLTPRGPPCDETRSTRCAAIWVQKFDPDDHAQGQYIRRLRALAAGSTWKVAKDEYVAGDGRCPRETEDRAGPYSSTAGKNTCIVPCTAASYHIGGKKFYRTQFSKSLPLLPMTAGEYTLTRLLVTNGLPTPPCAAPWPPPMARNSQCRSAYVTPQEGYVAGLLPKEWTNGGRTRPPRWAERNHRSARTYGEEQKEWARRLFGRRERAVVAPPPPPPVQQGPRTHDGPVPVCRRRPRSHSRTWFYTPGTTPVVPVGGSCNRSIIRAKSRRAAGMTSAPPTVVFRNLT